VPWRRYWAQLIDTASRLRTLVVVQLLTGFSLMALPFYVVYARERLGAPPSAIAWFLLIQVLGGVLADLLWARLVDRRGSRQMLTVCATLSALAPALAVVLGRFGWEGLLPVFFLAGAAFSGRKVGFQSALLEMAPEAERPTYASVNALLGLPVAFLTLFAGVLLQWWSYPAVFLLASIAIALGAVWTRRLPARAEASVQ